VIFINITIDIMQDGLLTMIPAGPWSIVESFLDPGSRNVIQHVIYSSSSLRKLIIVKPFTKEEQIDYLTHRDSYYVISLSLLRWYLRKIRLVTFVNYLNILRDYHESMPLDVFQWFCYRLRKYKNHLFMSDIRNLISNVCKSTHYSLKDKENRIYIVKIYFPSERDLYSCLLHVIRGNTDQVIKIINANPEYIYNDLIDRVAVANKKYEIVKYFLQNHAETTTENQYTAILNGDIQMLDLLHDHDQTSHWKRREEIEEILKNVKISNKEEILAWCTEKWKLQ